MAESTEIKEEKNLLLPNLTIKQKEAIAQDYEEIKRKYPHSFWKVLAEKYSSLWNLSLNRETLRCQMKYYLEKKKPDGSTNGTPEGNKLVGLASFESLDNISFANSTPLPSRRLSRSASTSNFSTPTTLSLAPNTVFSPEKIGGLLLGEYPELKDHLNFLYEEKIDLEAFLDLEDDHLKEFGIKQYGIRHRILRSKRLFSPLHHSNGTLHLTPQKRKRSKQKVETITTIDEDEESLVDEEGTVQVDDEDRAELEQRPDSECLEIEKDRSFLETTEDSEESQAKRVKLEMGEPMIN